MSVKKIEIVPWVKFNAQGVKDELEALAQSCISKMDFLSSENCRHCAMFGCCQRYFTE